MNKISWMSVWQHQWVNNQRGAVLPKTKGTINFLEFSVQQTNTCPTTPHRSPQITCIPITKGDIYSILHHLPIAAVVVTICIRQENDTQYYETSDSGPWANYHWSGIAYENQFTMKLPEFSSQSQKQTKACSYLILLNLPMLGAISKVLTETLIRLLKMQLAHIYHH